MPAAGEPVAWMAIAVDTVVRPTIEPTEMSSPPATMTTVWLIASTPRMVMPRPILRRLREEKNTSPRSVPKMTTRTASATSRLMLWTPTRSTMQRRPTRLRVACALLRRYAVERCSLDAVLRSAPAACGMACFRIAASLMSRPRQLGR